MQNDNKLSASERAVDGPVSGWLGVATVLLLFALAAAAFLSGRPLFIVAAAVFTVLGFFLAKGLLVLQPNESAVLTFFGRYVGTVRIDGFFWVNPFYARKHVSLRVRNFTTPTLKVNDRSGSPIEVAAVVTWRVDDTARAVFDIEDYETYTHMQSEMGLREVAGTHAYDGGHEELTLRGSFEAIGRLLAETVQRHVAVAGVEVMEAKLTHLAYAPEIASVMLRRQQAQAVVEARERLVEGVVGMTRQALERIESERIAILSDAERAALLTSLMTVLLSENGAQPVVQTGAGR